MNTSPPAGGEPAPFTPVAMPDLASLPSAGRHEFQAARSAGTQEAFEAWGRKWAQPNTGAPSASVVSSPDDADVAGRSTGDGAPVATMEPAVAAVAAKLEEHGSDIGALNALADPLTKFHERIGALDDDQAMASAILDGEEAILSHYYKGSEARMAAGLRDIEAAARLIGVDIEGINRSGVLADPDLHQRIHLLAANVLRHKGPDA